MDNLNKGNMKLSTKNKDNSKVITYDKTDGRKPWDWNSHYPPDAIKEIHKETFFIFFIFFVSLFLLFATWKGWLCMWLSSVANNAITLKRFAYYSFSGMLGGITFGMKYFYRCVARGWWHKDRRIWRIMSPFISMALSLIIGSMIDSTIMTVKGPIQNTGVVSIGFISGYFADLAFGKMYEIAKVIFGDSAITRSRDAKNGDGK